ncbi:MAG: leucine-rich repeat protein [Promethearchaeota archaeon]
MSLTPKKIFKQFEGNEINKFAAFEQLVSFIENSEDDSIRFDAIQILDKICVFNDSLFTILENIIISEVNEKIRNAAIQFINNRFLNKALVPLKWAIKNETDYNCLVSIIKSLENIRNHRSKSILFKEVKKIKNHKYINKEKEIENKKFKKIIKNLLKSKKYDYFTNEELSQILINYLTIVNLTKVFPNVYYELDPLNGLVSELDLSDYLEYEVKGTPFGWKNNIISISEIPGLNYLKQLKKIDLSNNQVEHIKDLTVLENITHLILTNNKISELVNLDYIKNFKNLEYLDLRGNKVALKTSLDKFNPKIRVLLRESYL